MRSIRTAVTNLFSSKDDRELSAALMDALAVLATSTLLWVVYVNAADALDFYPHRFVDVFTMNNIVAQASYSLATIPLSLLAAIVLNAHNKGRGMRKRSNLATVAGVAIVSALSTFIGALLMYGSTSGFALLQALTSIGFVAIPATMRVTAQMKPVFFGDDLGVEIDTTPVRF